MALTLLSPLAGGKGQAKIGTDPLLQYQGDATHQSLYAIHAEAVKFLDRERPNRSPGTKVIGPDIREQYPRCIVPLKMQWQAKSRLYAREEIHVFCAKTSEQHTPTWYTILSLHDPVAHARWLAAQKPGLK